MSKKEHIRASGSNPEVTSPDNDTRSVNGSGTWQKCPICNGTGRIFSYNYTGGNHFEDCVTCGGKKIISKLTGKPPK
jgi:DnaJ-class molecular chaperone